MKDKYNIKEDIELRTEEPAIGEVLNTDFMAVIKICSQWMEKCK